MNKLQMAHEYAMLHMKNPQYKDVDDLDMVQWAFDYADAMQAEADKREQQKQDKLKQDQQNHHDELVSIGLEEWQPDWSQAPDWAEYWYMTRDNKFQWCSKKPYQDVHNWFVDCGFTYTLDVAPSFGYTGDWRNSLHKRPE